VDDGSFPFAMDVMGNYYTIRFAADGPVRYHVHDDSESWNVAAN
jgi:hypothetical protein